MFKLRHSKAYWIVSLANRIDNFKWWVLHRVHPKYRYHVHKFHRLDPGWHDVDYKMLHACFDFLVEFVEKEDGLKTLMHQYQYCERDGVFHIEDSEGALDQEGYELAKHIYNEVRELYDWWKNTSEAELNDLEFHPDKDNDFCTNQLLRLIKVRRYLWT